MPRCDHFDEAALLPPPETVAGCEECFESGDNWVHLRMCLACGHIGCCDSSKNRHARRHYQTRSHPLIRSVEPGERWGYCYVDDQYTDLGSSRDRSD